MLLQVTAASSVYMHFGTIPSGVTPLQRRQDKEMILCRHSVSIFVDTLLYYFSFRSLFLSFFLSGHLISRFLFRLSFFLSRKTCSFSLSVFHPTLRSNHFPSCKNPQSWQSRRTVSCHKPSNSSTADARAVAKIPDDIPCPFDDFPTPPGSDYQAPAVIEEGE